MGKKLTMISVRLDDAELTDLEALRSVISPNKYELVSKSYAVRCLLHDINHKLLLARGNGQRKQGVTLYDKEEVA